MFCFILRRAAQRNYNFKKTSSLSNMKFYFLSLRIKVGSLTSINISLCGNCILKFWHGTLFVRKINDSGTLFSDLHSLQKKLLQWSNFTPQITILICRHLLSFQRNINSHRKLTILNSGTYFLSCPCFLLSPSSSSKPSPTYSSGSTFAHKTGEADNIFLTYQHSM